MHQVMCCEQYPGGRGVFQDVTWPRNGTLREKNAADSELLCKLLRIVTGLMYHLAGTLCVSAPFC